MHQQGESGTVVLCGVIHVFLPLRGMHGSLYPGDREDNFGVSLVIT